MNEELKKKTIASLVQSRFPDMNEEGIKILNNSLIERSLSKGEFLLKEGETASGLIFVGQGMLRQYYYKNRKDVTEHFSYEGFACRYASTQMIIRLICPS